MLGGRILVVHGEVAEAQELEACGRFGLFEHLLHLAAREDLQRIGVHALDIILAVALGIFVGEEVGIEAHLGVRAAVRVHPVQRRALDLASVGRVAAAAFGIVGREDLDDIAVLVPAIARAADQIRALQAALGAVGVEALVFRHRLGQEIVLLHIHLAGEGDQTLARLGIVRVVFDLDELMLALGVVRDRELHGAQHRHGALGVVVQVLAQAVLEEAVVHRARHLRDADAVGEIADGRRGVAAAAQSAERRHARIVPAGDDALFDEAAQLALGHDRVVDAEAAELDLARLGGDGHVVHDPVVQRTVILILQRAETVRDALERVLNRVREVVHRVDAPLVALTVMLDIADAVEHRVAHVEVAAREIDLRAQRVFALGELAVAHPLEEIEALLDRAVAPRALGGGVRVAAVFLELLRRQLAHIGQTFFDQLHGELVVLLKVVRAEEEPVAPVKAEPVNVLLNGLDELVVLLGGVRVVHAEIAQAAEALGRAEVDAQRLAVADVQITVRLGRKTGVYGLTLKPSAGADVLLNEGFDKVSGSFVHGIELLLFRISNFSDVLYTKPGLITIFITANF